MKVWIATTVEFSEQFNGKARIVGVFKTKAEAKEFVNANVHGCMWNIEEVDIPESFMWCGNNEGKDDTSPKPQYVEIMLNGPEYRGAPYPAFNEKAVNESEFEDELRGKSWWIEIKYGTGYVEWLSYDGEYASDAWKREIKRAFKANGLEAGKTIYVKFGSKDSGLIHEFELQI